MNPKDSRGVIANLSQPDMMLAVSYCEALEQTYALDEQRAVSSWYMNFIGHIPLITSPGNLQIIKHSLLRTSIVYLYT